MARLDRNGVDIHYEIHGNGPPVLLSHGYSATCRMWDGQIAAFKDRYKIIVWDMRRHGESDYPADHTPRLPRAKDCDRTIASSSTTSGVARHLM